MSNRVPAQPKIYHIVHVNRLDSIISEGCLWSCNESKHRQLSGTTIGMPKIKERRSGLYLKSCPSSLREKYAKIRKKYEKVSDEIGVLSRKEKTNFFAATFAYFGKDRDAALDHLHYIMNFRGLSVGKCVPFYFCPRSPMLHVISRKGHYEMTYVDGQEPIIHLEADLHEVVDWAEKNEVQWAFTNSNAGSYDFQDWADLSQLDQLNWEAINSRYWSENKGAKQAEFLMKDSFPWELFSRIGVYSQEYAEKVREILLESNHRPPVEIHLEWYYL